MKYKLLLLLSVFAFGEEIEVRLKTASELKPVYVSYCLEEFRDVLEFDLNTSGYASVLPIRHDYEEVLKKPLNLTFWRKERVPYIISLGVEEGALQATLHNVERGTARRYTAKNRQEIHKMADAIHKELFGIEGIASCRLIYSLREKKVSGWVSEICVSDSDGANAEQVTFENDYCVSPFFYPHSHGGDAQFFFVSYKQGQSKIYRSSLKSKQSENVFELRGSQVLPTINAKGSQMAFISDAAGRPDLFVQSFDPVGRLMGKAKQLFSAPRATQASPTFSPDGKKVAFVSDKDGTPRIYVIDVHSIKPRLHLLTKRNRENTSPSWSPDGKKLAYSAKVDGIRQIWIYDFDSEEESALTMGPENKENPTWAPDSHHLVYNTETDDASELYLINLRQKEPLQITKGAGQKRFASWENWQIH